MQDIETVKVDLGPRSYNILVGQNLLDSAYTHIKEVIDASHYIIITDEKVPSNIIESVQASFNNDTQLDTLTIASGESSKCFECIERLTNQIFALGNIDRSTVLIALGGGVVGDIVGFVASIMLRGINFIQVPTTLLSQVDSSVGGKTGINNQYGKNLIGSFYQPKLVLADISALKSLPKRQFLAGYAEIVKYAIINDPDFFVYLEDNLPAILQQEFTTLQYIIAQSCRAKANIVAIDEREGGTRALLNLGHTFAHALEQQMAYDGRLLHGEAVAIGMIFALTVSHNLGYCSAQTVEKVKKHLSQAGLPTSPLDVHTQWSNEQLLSVMHQDKKVQNGKLVFILANNIGDTFIQKDIDALTIRDNISEFTKES